MVTNMDTCKNKIIIIPKGDLAKNRLDFNKLFRRTIKKLIKKSSKKLIIKELKGIPAK
jgi:hypothetical protein